MSKPRVRPALGRALAAGPIATLGVSTACRTEETPCTPESSGFGGQARATWRVLEGLDPKEGECRPRLVALRSEEELLRAYGELGFAVELPPVDWSKETVVLREATHTQGVTWGVVEGTTLTLGTQGCLEQGTTDCYVELFAVEALITTVNGHVCADIGCAGVSAVPPE